MEKIATFFTHFGAVRMKRACDAAGVPAKLMPVPRALSSSCGTCVRYESDALCPGGIVPGETEQIVEIGEDKSYRLIWRVENA